MTKRLLWAVMALALLLQTGCAAGGEEDGGRTVVTMLFTEDLTSFEALVEETYPDIDLQVERNTEATIDGESERRLHNDRGTDIVTSTMPTGDVVNYVMDLSAEPYIDRYQTAIFQNVSRDGRTLFIPLPGQFYGYIYNATLFEENDIQRPASRQELLAAMDTAAEKGVGLGADGTLFGASPAFSVLSTWLIATQVPDFLSTAEGIIWNQKVLKGEASFVDGMAGCLDVLGPMVDRGYMNPQTMNTSAHREMIYTGNAVPLESRMLDGTMLICYSNTRLLNYLRENTTQYEYEMLPFLSNKGGHPWTITTPDAYLSINAALTEPGNEKKLSACSRVLDLLSTPEGQSAYLHDCGAAHSYLTSYHEDMSYVPEGIRDCVEEGYVYNIRMPAKLMVYFAREMVAVLNGLEVFEDALAKVDKYNREGDPETDYQQNLVGLMGEDLIVHDYNVRQEETAIGNLVTDAVRELVGTDMAMVNGGSIRSSLYAGNVYGSDLEAVCPYPNDFIAVEMKGSVIREALQNGISMLESPNGIPGGRFLNVSGLRYTYRRTPGESAGELLEVTLPDGTPLEDDKTYTVAISDYMAGSGGYIDNNGDGFTMLNLYDDDTPLAPGITLLRETEQDCTDAMRLYFENHRGDVITAQTEGRIKVVTADG